MINEIVFTLLLLTMTMDRPVSSAVILSVFQQQALIEHNFRRQLHCTTSMVLNATLNAIAQNYSEYLAANNLFQHSGRAGLGENLWSMSSSATINFVNGSTPTISWYNEISAYNYSSPGFASGTGHFTQVIWQNSIQLGVGIAFSSNNRSVKVVANYFPPGNVIGSFPANVLPLCLTTTAGSTSSNPPSTSSTSSNPPSTSSTSNSPTTTRRTSNNPTTTRNSSSTGNSSFIINHCHRWLLTVTAFIILLFNLFL